MPRRGNRGVTKRIRPEWGIYPSRRVGDVASGNERCKKGEGQLRNNKEIKGGRGGGLQFGRGWNGFRPCLDRTSLRRKLLQRGRQSKKKGGGRKRHRSGLETDTIACPFCKGLGKGSSHVSLKGVKLNLG